MQSDNFFVAVAKLLLASYKTPRLLCTMAILLESFELLKKLRAER